ncbi:piggyBac transposable element-derived protein 4-like isoform X3 [Bicyclus anynana]|uniref:PiggyBac transposable element-derived protein 4-like isoform X3 n=1 Tax=Bicyclus anynana TaxID=110368 RepID=A0A6J1NQP6_BICAN|nr:piggyBac transposable element-derived protein 4-like isoform X3 [Bicyclus anynana]
MDGGINRPMCDLRRGTGVRVRGPRGPSRSPLVAGLVEDAVVGAGRGGPRKRCRTRGGRVNTSTRRPGPRTIDELVICDISEMPQGQGLETPLHPKKQRRFIPSKPAKQPRVQAPPPSSSLSDAPSQGSSLSVLSKPPKLSPPPSPSLSGAPSPGPSSSVISEPATPRPRSPPSSPSLLDAPPPEPPTSPPPVVFVEYVDFESNSSSISASPLKHPSSRQPHTRRSRRLLDEESGYFTFYGSDDDTGESDDENEIAVPVLPRVFRSMMETPLDDSEPVPDTWPAVGLLKDPLDLYEFNWRPFPNPPIPPNSRRETFSVNNVGPTNPGADPYDIFIEIWDRQIMEHIAWETNKYAQEVAAKMIENNTLRPNSRICQWYDTTPDELYTYFGLVLAMGVVGKSRIEEYWSSTPDVFYTPGFSAHMTTDRFLILSKCLHFNDNSMCALDLDHSEARLFKIQPILSHLNNKFQKMYTLRQNIAVDESLLKWKGSLEISQIIPNKAAHRGIKTYEICESQTGYLWRFEVHAHKRNHKPASTTALVLKLIEGLEHKGYTLWMDSFYQSPCLARQLKLLGFDCAGTLRTDRKFVPQALNILSKQDMRLGEITGLTAGDVDVMVWRDMNKVGMISTYHGNGQNTVQGSTKPILILDYNIMMGGVDKKDQLLSMYPVERKRTRVWYKKLFKRLLNVSVLNAYIIHHHTSRLSHRNFRMNLVNAILAKHCTPLPILNAPARNKKVDVSHRLGQLPSRKNQRLRRTCVNCKKLVRTFCVGCTKSVCMHPCFLIIHS